jgi:multidrug efflux pump subunit AcrB
MSDPGFSLWRKGPLAWMTANPVAANLFMLVIIVGGLAMGLRVKQELFPEFDLDLVVVSVAYPGASPEEVERSAIEAIEDAIEGVDGIKEITATAGESGGSVVVELLLGADREKALSDIRNAVDRITTFPQDMERPLISLVSNRSRGISLVIYGDLDEATLRALAERARDELLADERITQVDMDGVRPFEISVEISRDALREYGLTLEQVSQAISLASVELPSGGIDTATGEVLIRLTERRDWGSEFEEIVLLSTPGGTEVTLGDVAVVDDGFADTDEETLYNGQPAVRLNVYRTGEQSPIDISEAVYEYLDTQLGTLPPGVEMAIWADTSEMYRARIDLLMRNAQLGLLLVLIILGLFLEVKLAFWVTLGIPISFLGAIMLMPAADVSINMISLFVFILTLGIVVDDAIIVGESVYHHRGLGKSRLRAAVDGVREVVGPVTFAVLTSVIFFVPLFFIPGFMGKFFVVIPKIAILVLLFSLIESLLILPAHLAHSKPSTKGWFGLFRRGQQAFDRGVEWVVQRLYIPSLRSALHYRFLTLSVGFAMLAVTVGVVAGGYIKVTFFPRIESDVILTPMQMTFGTPVERTREVQEQVVAAARATFAELGSEETHSRGILSQIGSSGEVAFGPSSGGSAGGHLAQTSVFLVEGPQRPFTARQFAERWRERVGEIEGLESIRFNYSTGPGSERAINIELSHSDMSVLEAASERVAAALAEYSGVVDIDDGFSAGKEQLDVTLRPDARSLGVTEVDLARQLRASFFGAEAARQQRGRDELRVYVRLPDDERTSEHDIESLVVRTRTGGEVPLTLAADIERGRAFTTINRRNGRRVIDVTADVDEDAANANEVLAVFAQEAMPGVLADFPGLSYRFTGEQQEQAEVGRALGTGGLLAFFAMFGLMAVAFRSYLQPILILVTVPFGFVGAAIGHLVMGFNFSLMSAMGMLALAGIVVNDSLVLIDASNRYRDGGMQPRDAIVAGASRRFRAIWLTSLTTFFGLMPMILETSVQARFLVPMAVSLGFGVLFATFITLLLVPAFYLTVEDVRGFFRRRAHPEAGDPPSSHDEGLGADWAPEPS